MSADDGSDIGELAGTLLQVADRDLLERPLEALASTLPEPFMAESLLDLVTAGFADTLSDALVEGRLDRFVAERCTAREGQALLQTLRALLGDVVTAVGDDDPARLAEVPEPPEGDSGLRAWAALYGVEDALGARDGNLSDDDAARSRSRSRGSFGGERAPLWQQDSAMVLRSGLWRLARQRRAADLRTERWADGVPPPALTSLHQRLRDLALPPAQEVAEPEVGFVPARPVTLDPATAMAQGCLRLAGDRVTGVQLLLSGHEQRGLSGQCELCGPGRCDHVRRVAARLLDATLDAGDRLHAALLEVGDTPSWRRLVNALSMPAGAQQGQTDPIDQAGRGELVFRLTPGGGQMGFEISTLLRSPRRGGGLSSGRVLTLAQASRSRAVTDEDRVVLDALRLGSRPLSTTTTPADTMSLRALSQHPRVRMQDRSTAFRVVETAVLVRFVEQGDGLLPEVSLTGAPGPVPLPPDNVGYLSRIDESADALFFAPLAAPVRRLLRAMAHFRGVLPPESYDSLGPWLAQVRQVAQLQAPPALLGRAHPVARRLLLRLSQGPQDALQATLSARPLPLGALWPPGHGPEVVHGFVDGHTAHARRDLAWERDQAASLVAALGLDRHPRVEAFSYRVEGTEATLALLREAAHQADAVDLEWSERLRRLTLGSPLRAASLSVRLFKRGHWLQLEGGVVTGTTRVAVGRLLEAVRRGERFVPVEGDSYGEIEEALWHKLQAAEAFAIDSKEATRLAALTGPALLARLGADVQAGDEDTAQFLLRAGGQPATPPPEAVVQDLRPYQRAGLAWLMQRASWAPGACLADEMGLGKTIQAIALLRLRAATGPALVVAPTSVTANWLSECQRFAPDLRVHDYRGPRRQEVLAALGERGTGQVLIASYDVVLRDAAVLQGVTFATQVVDEAQWIKNSRTARARAVRGIDAGFRLALTGTPIENRLGDLYSLFALIAPGLLGTWARFRARFAVPIERYDRQDRSDHLHALVAPFILRRRKAEVADELPQRTEVIHRIELSAAERELYQAATAQARDNLRRRKQEEEASAAHVLADLTRLRQLACHPRLVLQRPDAHSSKLTALLRLLDDLLPRGHRALVFSQFVQHLSLVREALEARGVGYQYLDGSTPAASRGDRVRAFQEGYDPLFLISLKAGGAGLNLTAADYVFHLDPWWNPATEDQASDRVHRLGQTRPVTIVKLVTTDTIEERVLDLHAHKRALAESVLRGELGPSEVNLEQLEALLD